MWKGSQQLIRRHLEVLVKSGKAGKLTVIADEIGMEHDEFHSKISMNPRTPCRNEERIQIEREIKKRDREQYLLYLRDCHMDDDITIREE